MRVAGKTETCRNITTYQDVSIESVSEGGWGLSQLEQLDTDNLLDSLGIMDRGALWMVPQKGVQVVGRNMRFHFGKKEQGRRHLIRRMPFQKERIGRHRKQNHH